MAVSTHNVTTNKAVKPKQPVNNPDEAQRILAALEEAIENKKFLKPAQTVVEVNGKKYFVQMREVEPLKAAKFQYGAWDTRQICVQEKYTLSYRIIAELNVNGKLTTYDGYAEYQDDPMVKKALREAKAASPYTPREPRESFHPTHDTFGGGF